MEQRVSLVTLGVRDLARAQAFYEGLGWTTGAEPGDDVVFFQAGGMIVALWGRDQLAEDTGVADSGGWGGITLAYNARSPAEVDAVLAEAEAAGGAVIRPGAEYRRCRANRCSIGNKPPAPIRPPEPRPVRLDREHVVHARFLSARRREVTRPSELPRTFL